MGLEQHGDELGAIMSGYSRAMVAGLSCEDTGRGRVRKGPLGRPIPTYDVSDFDLARIRHGTQHLCRLLLEAGARRIILPFRGVPDVCKPEDLERVVSTLIPRSAIELVTVHLMGTAHMGGDAANSVTDAFGRVHGAEHLYVCDASLFPTPTGVNPAETIQALATRSAAHIIENKARWFS